MGIVILKILITFTLPFPDLQVLHPSTGREYMRRTAHLVIGALAFALFSFILEGLRTPAHYPWIPGFIVACTGTLAPDILEPATSRRHRGFFHSRGALALIVPFLCLSSLGTIMNSFFSDSTLFYYLSCFLLGYAVHLLADSLTPAGLPR
jgi:membrane-bound metal-dependent hydrolase YbcI (DUF457 family)